MGTGIEPANDSAAGRPSGGEIVQNIPVFGNATERQLGGCVIAVLHGKVDRQTVRRDLGEKIQLLQKPESTMPPTDGRTVLFHRPAVYSVL